MRKSAADTASTATVGAGTMRNESSCFLKRLILSLYVLIKYNWRTAEVRHKIPKTQLKATEPHPIDVPSLGAKEKKGNIKKRKPKMI